MNLRRNDALECLWTGANGQTFFVNLNSQSTAADKRPINPVAAAYTQTIHEQYSSLA